MLLGAARILKEMEDSLEGTVRLIFQPAEEGGAGGKRMREEGVLEKHPKPSYGFGMHVWPTLQSGTVAARPGALMAACERFEILVHGVGGHAASKYCELNSQTSVPLLLCSAIQAVACILNTVTRVSSLRAYSLHSHTHSLTLLLQCPTRRWTRSSRHRPWS